MRTVHITAEEAALKDSDPDAWYEKLRLICAVAGTDANISIDQPGQAEPLRCNVYPEYIKSLNEYRARHPR